MICHFFRSGNAAEREMSTPPQRRWNLRVTMLWVVLTLSCSWVVSPAAGQTQQTNNMNRMDHGPFVSSTLTLDPLVESEILAFKAIAVRVAPDAVMAFDTDLLRVAGAWTGGVLHWYPARDGLQEWPTPDGFLHFTNAKRPGWTTRNFNDPRPRPYGPLTDGRRYNGLHVHGDSVVLSYSVMESDVLEMFGFERVQEQPIFTRTLNVSPANEALSLHVVQAPEGRATTVEQTMLAPSRGYVQIRSSHETRTIGFEGLPEGATWRLQNSHLILALETVEQPLRFRIAIGPVRQNTDVRFMESFLAQAPALPDLSELQLPGPGRQEVVETQVELGSEEGPFVVDLLTLPRENPWQSHVRLSAIDFLSDGRAALASMSGDVWLVDGLQDGKGTLRWKRFAAGLNQPLGLRIVDDLIYVTGRDQITRLHDLDGDDHADFYESFSNQVMAAPNFHGFAMNLETDSRGNFYIGKGTPDPFIAQGVLKTLTPQNGTLLRVSPDGSEMEVIATGLRNPNGLSIGPNDEIYFADNEGNWVPTSTIHRVRPGSFHGYVPSAHLGRAPADEDFEKPIVWVPNFIDNSPAQPKVIDNPSWPAELQGHLLVVSYGRGTMSLVLLEEVDGKEQGAHLALPLEFRSGLQHTRFHQDGHLYVVGLTNWASRGHGGEVGSFHRLRYTGRPLRLPVEVRTHAGGLALRFDEPLDPTSATDPRNYNLRQWTYIWSSIYGSRQGLYSVNNPGVIGEDSVDVRSATLSTDGRSVFLEIPGLRPGPVDIRVPIAGDMPDQIEASLGIIVEIDYRLRAADGTELDHVIHKTIHRVPEEVFDPDAP